MSRILGAIQTVYGAIHDYCVYVQYIESEPSLDDGNLAGAQAGAARGPPGICPGQQAHSERQWQRHDHAVHVEMRPRAAARTDTLARLAAFQLTIPITISGDAGSVQRRLSVAGMPRPWLASPERQINTIR